MKYIMHCRELVRNISHEVIICLSASTWFLTMQASSLSNNCDMCLRLPGSVLVWNTNCAYQGFCSFLHFLQASARVYP
jgi:hypothetical protein